MQFLAKLLLLLVIITSGCGWHLKNTENAPIMIKAIIFDPGNTNSRLSYTIRNQLRLNGIKLFEKKSLQLDLPFLRIINFNLSRNLMSMFKNSWIAEYLIVLSVSATILIPGKDIYPINIKVCRSFFNDPSPLSKEAKQQIIINEMYSKVAELITISLSDQITEKNYNICNVITN